MAAAMLDFVGYQYYFASKTSYGTPFSVCQIWCESVQKWPSYCCSTCFKMAAAAILDFCTILILMVRLAAGPHFQPMFPIWCKYIQKWPTYGQKCDFQYGGRRHLEFNSGYYFCHLVLFG